MSPSPPFAFQVDFLPDRFENIAVPPITVPPVIRAVDNSLCPSDLFAALERLPGRVWLDSATAESCDTDFSIAKSSDLGGDIDDLVKRLSRYSFLTADPIHRLVASRDHPNPWPELSRLCAALPRSTAPALPPFQGGVVGILGYESARWLEPDALAAYDLRQQDDLPTPAMSFGVYDWTIGIDHFENRTWLICQGFSAADFAVESKARTTNLSASERIVQATARADQIGGLIAEYIQTKPTGRATTHRIDASENRDRTINQAAETQSVSSNFTSSQFQRAVAEIVERIRNGDSFQVNLAQRLTTPSKIDPAVLYQRLRKTNPAPFAGFYDGGTFQVISSSPEGFLQIRDRRVETRPIKGTVPRTGDDATDSRLAQQLLASEKDRAENIMIVDLMRNDLSRVCSDQSVIVSQLCAIERFQYVQHLVSVVEGELGEDVDVVDALMACFPGGSVTGAPKIEAMKTIAQLEPHPRGPYCGSMGYISCSGDADFNILIRTITSTGGKLQIPVGGGITARSQPEAEEAETWAKARGMLQALPSNPATNLQETTRTQIESPNAKISGIV